MHIARLTLAAALAAIAMPAAAEKGPEHSDKVTSSTLPPQKRSMSEMEFSTRTCPRPPSSTRSSAPSLTQRKAGPTPLPKNSSNM